MRGGLKLVVLVVTLAVTFALGWAVGKTGGEAVDPASLTDLERAFAERMQNVALVGQFTIEGRESAGGRPERYEIERVTKVGDSDWRFDARITYADIDVTLPVTVPDRLGRRYADDHDHRLLDPHSRHVHRAPDLL